MTTNDVKLNDKNIHRKDDVRMPRPTAPQPVRSAKLIEPEDLTNLVSKLTSDSISSYRPASLTEGPIPSSLTNPQSISIAQAAIAASNPGTPGPKSLFDSWPWSTMGRVFVGNTSDYKNYEASGSGVLVGRHTLLTASHVVPWEKISSGDWWVRFVPAYYNGINHYGDSYVAGWYGFHTDSVEGDDYVVCDLYEPLGDKCGWLGVASLKDSRYDDFIYTSVGYPGDVQKGEVPCVEYGLTIQDIDDEGSNAKELETRLFGGGGWSGGPLFSDIDGGTLVVGVRSGRETDFLTKRRVVHAGGRKLVDIVRYAHEQWKHFDWSGWFQIQFPGQFIGDLAICSLSPDHLQLFGVGLDGQMYSQYWLDAQGWSNWYALGGQFNPGTNPAAISRKPNTVEIFCRGKDNTVYQNYWPHSID